MKLLILLTLLPTLLTAAPPFFPALIPDKNPDYPVSAAVALPENMKKLILHERQRTDRDTLPQAR